MATCFNGHFNDTMHVVLLRVTYSRPVYVQLFTVFLSRLSLFFGICVLLL